MKKFTFLVGSLIVGLSASAQLYVTGANVEGAPENWAPATPLEVQLSNGVYTFQATSGFKISTVKGTWDDFNASAKMLDGVWNKIAGGNTATAALKDGSADISAPNPGNEALKISYEVSEDLSSIKATLPEGYTYTGSVVYPDLYLIGPAVGGWTLMMPDYKMTRSGNEYTITVPNLNGAWKINNGTWDFSLGQGEPGMPEVGTAYSLSDNNAADITTTITTEVTVKVTYNEGGPYTLLLTTDGQGGGGGGGEDPTDYEGWYFNFGTNSFMDQNNEGYYQGKAIPENGIVEYGEVNLGTDRFQIRVWNGKNDIQYSTANGTISADTPTVLTAGPAKEMVVSGATAASVYDVKWDMNTCTLTMTLVGGGQHDDDFNGWYVNLGWEGNPGYWKGTAVPETGIVEFSELKIGTDPFKVKVYNGKSDAFYSSTDGKITPGEAKELSLTVEDTTMTIEGAQTGYIYNAKYDCKTNTLTLTFVRDGSGDVEEPKEIYLIGDFNEWTVETAKKMTRQDNVYTLELADGLSGKWKFNDGTWDWNIGADAEGITPSNNEVYDLVFDGKDFVSEFTGAVTMTITNNDGAYTLKVNVVSGVETIDAEIGSTAVYFNLQGQRIDNPSNGVFVRVLNGKAEKIMK